MSEVMRDQSGRITTMTEFGEEHAGGFPVLKGLRGLPADVLVYADGAAIVPSWNRQQPPALIEPPADRLQQLQLQRRYEERFLSLAKAAGLRLMQVAGGREFSAPWNTDLFGKSPGDVLGCLQRVYEVGERHRKTLASITAEIDAHPVTQRQLKAAIARELEAHRQEVAKEEAMRGAHHLYQKINSL